MKTAIIITFLVLAVISLLEAFTSEREDTRRNATIITLALIAADVALYIVG